MGAYNTINSEQVCPSCGNRVLFTIQFKYGDVWQYEYHIGDPLRWGGNDIGTPGHSQVVLEGAAENCPVCGSEGPEYEVFLENDRIASVKPFSGEYDFVSHQETYIVLNE